MNFKYYIFDKDTDRIHGTNNVQRWAETFEADSDSRRIAYAEWSNGMCLSAVFLGIGPVFRPDGSPVLFEIMAFNLPKEDFKVGEDFQWRSTNVQETLATFEELTNTLESLYGQPEEKYTYKSKPNSKGT